MSIEQKRGFIAYLIPQYDEIALFAMSLTCALILFTIPFAGSVNLSIDSRDLDPRALGAAFVFLSGLVLSIYHAFTDRPKSELEKSFMLFFAVLLNSFSGILAGMYDLSTASGLLIFFPILNIANGFILLMMFRSGILSEANISDQHASSGQFAVTAAAVLVLFVICRHIYSLIWMQTFSICVTYATNLSRSVPRLFLRELQRTTND